MVALGPVLLQLCRWVGLIMYTLMQQAGRCGCLKEENHNHYFLLMMSQL